MQITKRHETLSVEKITNGFLVTLQGTDVEDNWDTEKFFVTNYEDLNFLMKNYFDLEKV